MIDESKVDGEFNLFKNCFLFCRGIVYIRSCQILIFLCLLKILK